MPEDEVIVKAQVMFPNREKYKMNSNEIIADSMRRHQKEIIRLAVIEKGIKEKIKTIDNMIISDRKKAVFSFDDLKNILKQILEKKNGS